MDSKELLEYFSLGEKNANDLLHHLNPKLEKRFKKACKDLAKIVDEVRTKYPDANIYVHEDTPQLLLGDSHSQRDHIYNCGIPQREMVAVASYDLISKLDCGGW